MSSWSDPRKPRSATRGGRPEIAGIKAARRIGVYGFAAHLANSLVRPRWLRALVVTPLVGFVALVGPSRIYQGHHWPTDVLASYLLGIASLLGLTALYNRLKRPETPA